MLGAFLFFLSGCMAQSGAGEGGAPSFGQGGKMKVVTTIFPAYDFARQVAGERAEVTLLLKPGMESHSYEPSPRDILEIMDSDLFL